LQNFLRRSGRKSALTGESDLFSGQDGKYRLITFLFILLSAGLLSADPLYMWHVSRGDTEMYLLGSIHILSEDFYPLPEFINDVSADADKLVLEVDIRADSLDTGKVKQLVLEKGFYHDGSRIEDILTADLNHSLAEALKTFGLSPAQVSSMKPWLLALTLQNLELEASGNRAELGMEQVLLEKYGDGEVIELEGMEYQLELLCGLSTADQLDLLSSTLEEAGTMERELNLIVQAWKKGDPDSVAAILELEGLSRSVSEKLLLERNLAMAGKAADLLTSLSGKHTVLFVAGAAHFCGEGGIPALLSERGFTVNQVDDCGSLPPLVPEAE